MVRDRLGLGLGVRVASGVAFGSSSFWVNSFWVFAQERNECPAQGGGGHAVLAPGYEYDWSNDGQVRAWGRVGL